jgi:hypothetical protein
VAVEPGVPVRWELPWTRLEREHIEVVHEAAAAEHLRAPWITPG